MKLNVDKILEKRKKLENHTLLNMNIIQNLNDLKKFMQFHVYAVWDFMCLTKSLQMHICPATEIWLPTKYNRKKSARLINEIVMYEESDNDISSGYISHFDLYIQSMLEIDCDITKILKFIESVEEKGITISLENEKIIPVISKNFVRSTFDFIETKKPHVIASAFAFGRETIIPKMFTDILNQLEINDLDAPKFFYYLKRHIQIDGEDHGPAALELVEELCEDDPIKIHEAEKSAIKAIESRITFFDEIENQLT